MEKIHTHKSAVQPAVLDQGFYPFPRTFLRSPVWQMGALAVELYLYLHLQAAYGPNGYTLPRGLHLQEGQVWTSWSRLRTQCRSKRGIGYVKPPLRTLRDAMARLIDAGIAAVKGANSGMVITLCDYVSCGDGDDQRRNGRRRDSCRRHVQTDNQETEKKTQPEGLSASGAASFLDEEQEMAERWYAAGLTRMPSNAVLLHRAFSQPHGEEQCEYVISEEEERERPRTNPSKYLYVRLEQIAGPTPRPPGSPARRATQVEDLSPF